MSDAQLKPAMKPFRIEMLCHDGWYVLKEHETEMGAVENYASHIEGTPFREFRLVRAELVDAHSAAVPGT